MLWQRRGLPAEKEEKLRLFIISRVLRSTIVRLLDADVRGPVNLPCLPLMGTCIASAPHSHAPDASSRYVASRRPPFSALLRAFCLTRQTGNMFSLVIGRSRIVSFRFNFQFLRHCQRTGAGAKAWCLRIRADTSLSLSLSLTRQRTQIPSSLFLHTGT